MSRTIDSRSPPSATGDPGKPCRVPAKRVALADAYAVPVRLPLSFIGVGLVSLWGGVGLLVFRPDILATYHYNQWVIAATQLFVLGWVLSVVTGASYQMIPVALERRLHNERLPWWHLGAHVIGVAGMVTMFWVWDLKQVGHFGSVLAVGIGWFVYNLGRTLARIPRWTVMATGVASALFWLSAVVLAGLYLAAAKCWAFSPFAPVAAMHAHAHLGVLGVFVLLIVGVSYRVVPLFALSEIQSARRARWSIALLNAGILGLAATILTQNPYKALAALLAAAGLTVYGWELRAILRARKRRSLDWGLRYFLTGVGWLGPVSAVGLFLAWPGLPLTNLTGQLEGVYGFLALAGVVSMALLGMLCKIVPFLVWYHCYSKQARSSQVPALTELSCARLEQSSFWSYLAGLVGASTAALVGWRTGVRWGGGLLALSLALYTLNMGKILGHLVRPKRHAPPLNSCSPNPVLGLSRDGT